MKTKAYRYYNWGDLSELERDECRKIGHLYALTILNLLESTEMVRFFDLVQADYSKVNTIKSVLADYIERFQIIEREK